LDAWGWTRPGRRRQHFGVFFSVAGWRPHGRSANYLAAEAIDRIFRNDNVCLLQQGSDVIIGCPLGQQAFYVAFEWQKQF
jgi:hypothetical protein